MLKIMLISFISEKGVIVNCNTNTCNIIFHSKGDLSIKILPFNKVR